MALKILETCINCDVCENACPESAISFDEDECIYTINPLLCTECEDLNHDYQCQSLCPVPDCIIKDK